MDLLEEDLRNRFEFVRGQFEDVPEEEAEYLELFMYICFLSYDIFVKKMLIERLIDEIAERNRNEADPKKGEEKKKEKKKKTTKE